jgi:hypothetical protein
MRVPSPPSPFLGAAASPGKAGLTFSPCSRSHVLRQRLQNTSTWNIGPFLDDVASLELSAPSGPTWVSYSRAATLAAGGPGAVYPPPMAAVLAVYDSVSHGVIVFSQWVAPNVTDGSADLWRLDLTSMQWAQLVAAAGSVKPTPLDPNQGGYWGMVFDPVRNQVVVYCAASRAVYAVDLATNRWWLPRNAQETAPDRRINVAVTYNPDAGGQLFMHGGFYASTVRESVYQLHLGTWLWDFPTSAQPQSPSRQMHALVFDPVAHRVVLNGGMRHSTAEVYPYQLYFADEPASVFIVPATLPPAYALGT